MTQILIAEHRQCGECRHLATVIGLNEAGQRVIQPFGPCACEESEHYGHVITVDHQACRHLDDGVHQGQHAENAGDACQCGSGCVIGTCPRCGAEHGRIL